MKATATQVALVVLGCLAMSCAKTTVTPTQVMVVVDAQAGVRAITARVQLVVRAGQGEASKWQQRHDSVVSTDASGTWPIELSLLPKSDDATRVYEVVATATDGDGNEVAQVRAISGFVPHRALTLSLRFDDACIAKVDACDASETCRAGKCVDAHVKASLLPSYDPGAHSLIDGKLDAGVGSERDGGITQHSDASTRPGEDASTSSIDGGGHGDAGHGVRDADASMQADSSIAPAPGDFPFAPSNIDLSTVDFDTAPTTTLDCGNATIDTSSSITITGWCGDVPVPKIRTQTDGPELVVLALKGLTVSAGTTLTLTGSRPIAFLVRGDVKIHGTIDASAKGTTPGPGGSLSPYCATGTGERGAVASNVFYSGGGGGGGYGGPGGAGGVLTSGTGQLSGGVGGMAHGAADLVPLRGGCSGGSAGLSDGGRGGGAVQLTARGGLTLHAAGQISANGGSRGAGSGGGSGGAVLLEGVQTTIEGAITVNGGAGVQPLAGPDVAGGTRCEGDGCTGGDTTPGVGTGANESSSSVAGGGGGGYGRIVIKQ